MRYTRAVRQRRPNLPGRVAVVLSVIAALLLCASVAGQLAVRATEDSRVAAAARVFYVDAEKNVPTAFSVLLLLFAAVLLGRIAFRARASRDRWRPHWSLLSVGVAFMAVDEAMSLHERLIPPVRATLGLERFGALYFAWVVPAIVVVPALALIFLWFWINLPRRTRAALFVGAAVFVFGAVGFEMVGGMYAEQHGTRNVPYSMIATVEEGLEMTGAIICVWALLRHLSEYDNGPTMFPNATEDAKRLANDM